MGGEGGVRAAHIRRLYLFNVGIRKVCEDFDPVLEINRHFGKGKYPVL